MSRLGGWGYVVRDDRIEERAGQSWWSARLEPIRGWPRQCSGCGEHTPAIHDLQLRRVRDLPLVERRVELQVLRVRVACPQCGPKLERLSWLDPYARVTRRLAESVGRLCEVMAARHVALFLKIRAAFPRCWAMT
jgi:transposase